MEMPIELSRLIQEFARPRTRPDWRMGGAFPTELIWRGINAKYYNRLIQIASVAQTFEEYEYMMQDSAIPDWF